MLLTYYGHSCFRLEIGGRSVLFDPFISNNPLAKHIDVDAIKADYVLVTHGHSDHIADLERIMNLNPDALLISSPEICDWVSKHGLASKTHAMNIGGSLPLEFGDLKMVYACHSNSLPDGTYGGTAAGFVLFTENGPFYHAGDTSLTMEMQLLADMDLKFALLPIGGNFTMDMFDAEAAASMMNCNHIIAMHYDTFPVIKIDKQLAMDNFGRRGLTLTFMEIGTTMTLHGSQA